MYRFKLFLLIFFSIATQEFQAQSFAPAPGNAGSTAIFKDSSIFLSWASGIELQRGYLDISDKSLGYASFGLSENALYQAEGNSFDIVSLGDSGIAILTFEHPIRNGDGFDFAVFENGFADDYVEYAFVEVSSDGIHFVRFPATSETPSTLQMGNFEYSDCRYVNNLAGKYRQGYGTPFDLEELKDSANLDVNNISHVKIIDVIGSIDPNFGTLDSQGNIINDPWPSAFDSGGFDLDAIGVLNQNTNFIKKVLLNELEVSYFEDQIKINSEQKFSHTLSSLEGKVISNSDQELNELILFKRGFQNVYFLHVKFNNNNTQSIKLFY